MTFHSKIFSSKSSDESKPQNKKKSEKKMKDKTISSQDRSKTADKITT